jgi:hypothetical protein
LFNVIEFQDIYFEIFPEFLALFIHIALVFSLCPECFEDSHDGSLFDDIDLIAEFRSGTKFEWASYSMILITPVNLSIVFLK